MARVTKKAKSTAPAPKKRANAPRKQDPIVEIARRWGSMIPEEELRRIPKDLAEQHDHYIYGTPKK